MRLRQIGVCLNVSAPTSKKLNPVEEDYNKSTVHAVSSTPEEPVVEGETADVTVDDEDVHEITVQTSHSWYPPLAYPRRRRPRQFSRRRQPSSSPWTLDNLFRLQSKRTLAPIMDRNIVKPSRIELTLKLMVQAKPTATTCSFQL